MRAGTDGATAEMRPAAYMVAAGHEESSKQDHHLRVFAMAKVPPHARSLHHPMPPTPVSF